MHHKIYKMTAAMQVIAAVNIILECNLAADLVNDAVFEGLLGIEPMVVFDVRHYGLNVLATVGGEDFGGDALGFEDVFGVDFEVGRLVLEVAADEGLVNHHFAVFKNLAAALLACGEQERRHRGAQAYADGADGAADEFHRVEDCHTGRHRATRTADVHRDGLAGLFHFEVEKAVDDVFCGFVAHFAPKENAALFEKLLGKLAVGYLADEGGEFGFVVFVEFFHFDNRLIVNTQLLLLAEYHLVDKAVFLGVFAAHPKVALCVLLDLLHGLSRVVREDFVEILLGAEHFLDSDVDVGSLTSGVSRGLVEHYARVFERVTLAGGARCEYHRAQRCGDAGADGGYFAGDVLHSVIDTKTAIDRAAGGVDVYLDVFRRVGGFEEEELRLYDVGNLVAELRADEDDAVGYQAREYVNFAEGHIALLDDRACHIGDLARVLVESVAADATVVDSVFPKFVVVCDDVHSIVIFFMKTTKEYSNGNRRKPPPTEYPIVFFRYN